MDGSPLTLARSHARKASRADSPTVAIKEHDLAAGYFATAAKGTENSEALRTLKLLEQHHERISRILKSKASYSAANKAEPTSEKPASKSSASTSDASNQAKSPYRAESASLASAQRPQRDAGSSIANNLASARGIPSNRQRRSGQVSSPALNQQQVEGKIVNPPRRSKAADTASKVANGAGTTSSKTSQDSSEKERDKAQSTQDDPAFPSKTEDAFNRFYSTFEGIFSRLSAPLTFAGLPLNPDSEDPSPRSKDPSTPDPTTTRAPTRRSKSSSTRPSSRATVEPEYSRLFSPATLAAVREEPGGANLGAAESFYVVPTTGGTMQYANILARHQSQHAQRRQQQQGGRVQHSRTLSRDSTGVSEEMDEFVDARETPGPPSPLSSRQQQRGVSTKTLEELHLENDSLRGVLDEMSRRLWQFEMGAQMGSVALQQSIRASLNHKTGQGDSPTASSDGKSRKGGDGEKGESDRGLEGKVVGLELEIGKANSELERVGRENEKLKGVVGRYRERWEKLKEGARTRRVGGTGGSGNDPGAGPETAGAGGAAGV